MTVPVWLGYSMLVSFSILIVGFGLSLITYFGRVLLNGVIPTIWITRQRFKIKNMSREQFDAYMTALRYEWTEEQINKGQKDNESTKN
jgi:hypothetical protein